MTTSRRADSRNDITLVFLGDGDQQRMSLPLEQRGYQILHAETAAEADAIAREAAQCIVLVGQSAAGYAPGYHRRPAVVALTGHKECRRTGSYDGHIAKAELLYPPHSHWSIDHRIRQFLTIARG